MTKFSFSKHYQVDKLLVGTSKGLITFHNGKEVRFEYEGLNITAIHQLANGEIAVAINHKHWGSKLFINGAPIPAPTFQKNHKTVTGSQAILKQIWFITDGGEKYPDRLWVGTEPGALFISEDRGQHWHLINGLWNHPSRISHQQWFGAGKDLPFIHSIIVDPNNNDCIYISVSCAGIFRSMDSGKTWDLMNEGMKAKYLPNPKPEAGYDPHQVLMHPTHNHVLWQQNHCGVYRSENGGKQWIEINDQYGFCISIDEHNPEEAWIIPVENETSRIPKDRLLRVLHTQDCGKSWNDASSGLPNEPFYSIVLRNGFAKKGDLMAFGTTNGNVYMSNDKANSWQEISTNLAKVNYISFIN